jgi:hypothetical protein
MPISRQNALALPPLAANAAKLALFSAAVHHRRHRAVGATGGIGFDMGAQLHDAYPPVTTSDRNAYVLPANYLGPDHRMPQPASDSARRRVLNVDGKTCILSGEPGDQESRPPTDRGLCTVDSGSPVIMHLQEFWNRWSDDRLAMMVSALRSNRLPPASTIDIPAEVDAASIREEWDIARGHCRSIRWMANGRRYHAWLSSVGWSSIPDMPLGHIYWTVRHEDGTLEDPIGTEFNPPTDEWWSPVGVVRAAMEAIGSDSRSA